MDLLLRTRIATRRCDPSPPGTSTDHSRCLRTSPVREPQSCGTLSNLAAGQSEGPGEESTACSPRLAHGFSERRFASGSSLLQVGHDAEEDR